MSDFDFEFYEDDEEDFIFANIEEINAASNGELSLTFLNEFNCPIILIPYFGYNFYERRLHDNAEFEVEEVGFDLGPYVEVELITPTDLTVEDLGIEVYLTDFQPYSMSI